MKFVPRASGLVFKWNFQLGVCMRKMVVCSVCYYVRRREVYIRNNFFNKIFFVILFGAGV